MLRRCSTVLRLQAVPSQTSVAGKAPPVSRATGGQPLVERIGPEHGAHAHHRLHKQHGAQHHPQVAGIEHQGPPGRGLEPWTMAAPAQKTVFVRAGGQGR